jgi:hypothetical protein
LDEKVTDEREPRSGFERHAQTIIGGILLALLLWTGSSLIDVRDRLGRIEVYQINAGVRDSNIDREVSELRNRVRDIELQEARRLGK